MDTKNQIILACTVKKDLFSSGLVRLSKLQTGTGELEQFKISFLKEKLKLYFNYKQVFVIELISKTLYIVYIEE